MSQRIIDAHRLQKKKKGETVSESQHKTSYEGNIFTYVQNPMTKVLGLHVTTVLTFKRRKLQATKKLSLRHLSIVLRSRRGRGNFLARSRRWHWMFRRWRWCTDTAEAAEGEIVVNKAGANFFAFSKNAFISSRVWP
jgi:hypothetical protein